MREVILFLVGNRKYGIDITGMQGIEPYQNPTLLQETPEIIEGIATIRDEVYPVLNLANRFRMSRSSVTKETSYLIMDTNGGKLACVVDEVIGIHAADGTDVQEFPPMMRTDGTNYVDFVIRIEGDNDLVIIIDPKNLLTTEQAEQIMKLRESMNK